MAGFKIILGASKSPWQHKAAKGFFLTPQIDSSLSGSGLPTGWQPAPD
jgi:hypothetical protein